MALTENQVNEYVKKATGRDATPYEIKTFSTAPIQQLASLNDYYSKLNKDQSITDYLKYTGQDPESRMQLAEQYGITNPGTAEGNISLLNALKSGTQSVASTIPGTVTPTPTAETTTTPSIETTAQTSGDNTGGGENTSKQPSKVEGIDQALTQYRDIQKQIGDIDNTLARILNDKKEEIARSGGIVNESQLRSEVLSSQAPLLQMRRELATQQAQAGKMYTDLLARQKENDANFYKQQSAELAQHKQDVQESQFTEKQTLTEEKMTAQQQQFEQNMMAKGWKKVNDISDGIKVGEHFVNLYGQNVKMDSQTGVEIPIGTGYQTGSINSNISSGAKSTSSGKITYTDFSKVPDAPTPENINTIYPGTGKTYGALYEDAVTFAETGKYATKVSTRSPSSKEYDKAVTAKAANIANSLGMTEQQLRIAYGANKKAVETLIKSRSTTLAFESKAKAQIDIIINGYIDPRTGEKVPSLNTSVSRSDYPLINGWLVSGKQLAGDTNAQLLSNALITFTNEFAKIMTSATGSVSASTDSARKEASGLVSKALSEGTLEATLGLMQKEMETTITGYDEQIKSTMGSFVGAGGGSAQNFPSSLDKNVMSDSLKSKAGEDGKVSPDDWKAMEDLFTSHGGTAEGFNSQFGEFKNPNNPNYK